MRKSVIVSTVRTPIGKFGGALASFSAIELGAIAIKEAIAKAGITADQVEEVIMGTVVAAGQGQIPSRQAAAKAGLPMSVRSTTINKVCASGLRAVTMADQIIRAGDADIIVAGGMESMSNAPYLLPKVRWGLKMGDAQMVDSMIHDGLWCAFHNVHMAVHGSNVAAEFGVTREMQDEWSVRSHLRAAQAIQSGRFAQEIVPVSVSVGKGETKEIATDESVRPDTTLDKLAKLKPVFKVDGSITAGNAPGINDGAGALVIMSEERAASLGLKPLARIISHGEVGEEAPYLATVPARAIQKALAKANLSVSDLDVVEINEAFAAVALTSTQLLGIDPEKVNVNGGAVALGHPIGASGARILGSVVLELIQQKKRYGAVGICSGAAQGDAVIVENLML